MRKGGRTWGGLLIAAVLGVVAVGCGDNTTSDPPQLLSITPDDGSIAVPLNANVVVTFDHPMDKTTVEEPANITLLKVSDSSSPPGSLTYNTSTFTAIFDPTQDLEPETLYQVTLTREIRGESGEALAREYTWTFRTGRLTDLTPPTFAGAKEAAAADIGTSAVTLRWDPATDNLPQEEIVYLIYRAAISGAENYTTPTYTTAPGATSYAATGLTPNTEYFFVVLARDRSGNISQTFVERSAVTTP